MHRVLVGCPYTQMSSLVESIKKSSCEIRVINVEDIVCLNFDQFIIGGNDSPILFSDIKSAFIRYPYDLIPPNSGSFILRERTEFYKTVSLMLKHCAINPIDKAWELRNRLFSLSLAKANGINVPTSKVVSKNLIESNPCNNVFLKAMGNCFVTENESEISQQLEPFLQREEDDGDYAWILPAQQLNAESLTKYVDCIGYGFFQNIIKNINEYRIYIINTHAHVYKRKEVQRQDKSKAGYINANSQLDKSYINLLKNFTKYLGFDYMCLDVIESEKGYYLIDINPYGSLPPYSEFPESTDELAKLIINKSTGLV